MSGVEPTKIDYQGLKLISEDDTQSITFKMEGVEKGIKLDYDIGTANPKAFSLTPSGFSFVDNAGTKTTGLERIALVQTALASVELPPNATTLKLNKTLLLDAGIATQSTTINDGTAVFSNASAGGATNPQLTLTNTNATGSVALEVYKNKPTAGVAGDILFNQSVYGKDNGNVKQEYTRVSHTLRDSSIGGEDGSIEFSAFVNGAVNTFLQINGNENEINALKNIDLGGNAIRSSTGSMTITTAPSSGTGILELVSKNDLLLNSNVDINMTTIGGAINISGASSTGTGHIVLSPKTSSNVLVNGVMKQTWTNGTDTSDITYENDILSLNNAISQYYQSPAGNIQTLLQSIPSIHRFQQLDSINGRDSQLSPASLILSNTAKGTNIVVDNNFATYENKLTLSANDNTTPTYTLAEIVNRPSNQSIQLTCNLGTSNSKTLTLMNETTTSSSLTFNNQIDTNPFNITSNQDLNISSSKAGGFINLTSTSSIDIEATGDNLVLTGGAVIQLETTGIGADIIIKPETSAGDLVLEGGNIERSSSSGSSGQFLRIKLNGTYYRIALDSD